MLFTRIVYISVLIVLVFSQVTNVAKKNPLLSRKKRYLTFPMNSNFGISMAYVKALMVAQPRGWNALGECDFPFPLPSDTRLFKAGRKSHYIHRRELLTGLQTAFTQGGFNGTACVNRMICEAHHYIDTESKSLVKDILSAIFMSSEMDLEGKREDFCHDTIFSECEIPFLGYILSSLFADQSVF